MFDWSPNERAVSFTQIYDRFTRFESFSYLIVKSSVKVRTNWMQLKEGDRQSVGLIFAEWTGQLQVRPKSDFLLTHTFTFFGILFHKREKQYSNVDVRFTLIPLIYLHNNIII